MVEPQPKSNNSEDEKASAVVFSQRIIPNNPRETPQADNSALRPADDHSHRLGLLERFAIHAIHPVNPRPTEPTLTNRR